MVVLLRIVATLSLISTATLPCHDSSWSHHLSCRRFFDPSAYRVILFDQRGCGRSTPIACLAENTTADLVSDLETLRATLGIRSWLLLGGSWGVALSVAYAQAHPDRVLGLVLRGVCLMRPSEIQWMYGGGAAALKPLAWSRFAGQLAARERGNPLLAYYKRMLSSDVQERKAAVSGIIGCLFECPIGVHLGGARSSNCYPFKQHSSHTIHAMDGAMPRCMLAA
eukprot:GHRQ01018427.1.p1 GENE.GHRQ01018427.1~~GHRQ01018427.1.p1  ORF type:complete len:224 (-),score=30.43 GHRQ01018427.1:312-983(-)